MQKTTRLTENSVIWKVETDSTNLDAYRSKADYPDKTVWAAEYQTAGRGQRGNHWNSDRSENLTFSILLKPREILASRQFVISEAASVAMIDYLSERGITARIKWPNDIYVGDKKICGMLIEHIISGDKVSSSIIGIGLNVRQRSFPDSLPNPVSMSLCSVNAQDYDLKEELAHYLTLFYDIYDSLENKSFRDTMENRYLEHLYRKDEWHFYNELSSDGVSILSTIRGCITGIDRETSRLKLKISDGTVKLYAFKEIAYII